jgi:hypothetical protein
MSATYNWVRACTGAPLSFQLAGLFGNALIPIVAVQFLTAFISPWRISIYLAGFLL